MPALDASAATSAKLTIVLWLVVFAFVAPATIFAGQVATLPEGLQLLVGTATGIAFSALLYCAFRATDSWRPTRRVLALGAVVVAISALQTAADFGAQFAIRDLLGNLTPPLVTVQTVLLTNLIYLAIYSCNTAMFWIVAAWQGTQVREVELAQSRARAAALEMETLRLQLNPHFLGNALNGISTLILARRFDQAGAMTDRLAHFLRASIEARGATVTLREELELLEAYLDVEAARFGDRLRVEIECEPDAMNALTPQFILQPLVENAVKHAVAQATRPVCVTISAEREAGSLLLQVTDDGDAQAAKPNKEAAGIGLRNTRNRLAVQYPGVARLDAGRTDAGYRVAIRLPYALAPA